MADLTLVESNLRKMIDQGAPVADTDAYLAGEGFTPEQFRTAMQRPPVETAKPAAGPGFGEGIVQGVRNIGAGGGQLIGKVLEAVAPAGSPLEAWAREQTQESERVNAARRAAFEHTIPPRSNARIGEFIGEALPMAVMPGAGATGLGPRIAAGAGAGAFAGTTQPVEGGDYWAEKAKQVGIGAATGGGLAPLTGAAARMVSPRASVNPGVQALLNEGVRMTPGQMSGPFLRATENKFTSAPILGDLVMNAYRMTTEDLNRAGINRALTPIGERLPKDIPVGRAAVDYMQTKISEAYGKLLPQLSAPIDAQFKTEVMAARANVPVALRDDFDRIIIERIVDRGTTLDGKALNDAQSELGAFAKRYRSSALASERDLGDAANAVQGSLLDLLGRQNPAHQLALQRIKTAYANSTIIDRAASSTGAKEGIFGAAQLAAAVRANSPTVRKRGFAAGNALMQDLSDPAAARLPPNYPDSGTAGRLFLNYLAGGGAAYLNPAAALGAISGTGALYSRPGLSAAAYAMARRPPWAPQAAQAVRLANPLIAQPVTRSFLDRE